uniref:Secreted protein n=1 Tax=Pyxicephalus adspersus TaxID=30357 RepID=A0AAV3A5U5_PYXAD|nr:TPA: hypothetical protein GDO54_015568 [Pyxicephalus adspersus]
MKPKPLLFDRWWQCFCAVLLYLGVGLLTHGATSEDLNWCRLQIFFFFLYHHFEHYKWFQLKKKIRLCARFLQSLESCLHGCFAKA